MSRYSLLRRIGGYFFDDRAAVGVLLATIALSTLCGLAAVWPMAILIDSVLVPGNLPDWLDRLNLSESGNRGGVILLLAAGVLVLRVLQELLTAARTLLNTKIAQNGMLRLRCDVFTRLQMLSLGYHRGRPQGDMIYRLTNDAQGCQQILGVAIEVLVAAFTLVVMLAIMFSRSLELTLIALAVVPFLLAANLTFGRVIARQSRQARQLESDFTATLHRSLGAIELIQVFGRESDESRRFRSSAADSQQAWYRFHQQMSLYRICIGMIFGLGAAAIFGFGGSAAYHDQILGHNPSGMTVGSLMVFVAYLGMLYDPLCKISGAGANMAGAVAGMERVFELLDAECEIVEAPGARPLEVRPRRISFDTVSFAYIEDKPVLRNVQLTIRPGEMAAFVGSSGVGKSTILKLLCRLIDPSSGGVRLDDEDLRNCSLKDVRKHVAVVLQENFVLPATVAENIAYGRPDATLELIREAAELAGAAEFIRQLPNGLETVISEGGANLSGGQRQRIALARALLTEAPILVLDEPTSALDAESERWIGETLNRLKGRRTVVLVSHRLKSVAESDQIFVMHEGRIVGQGTHAELLARRGWYYRALTGDEHSSDPSLAVA